MNDKILENVLGFFEEFSKVAKKKASERDREFLLDYGLKKAWKDAVIHERLHKPSSIIENKIAIGAILKAELVGNLSEIYRDFDGWHNDLCERTDYGMRYGIWQKFINMLFKYLYCMKELFPEFNDIWAKCHCPIDSIIAGNLRDQLLLLGVSKEELELSYRLSRSDQITWNYISKENYAKFQEQVQLVGKAQGISPLEFDFLYWKK